jgi:hypothetical protein
MKPKKFQNQNFSPFQSIDFTKASPEAVEAILVALNFEVDAAFQEKRVPLLDRAFDRLFPTVNIPMM